MRASLLASAWLLFSLMCPAQLHAEAATSHATLLAFNADWLIGGDSSASPTQQEPQPGVEQSASAAAPPVQQVTVRGTVLNGATGQPLPRALVMLKGSEANGALTDGEGHFEITDVPIGRQIFDVIKPGFGGELDFAYNAVPTLHIVRVAAKMPELTFSLKPKNALFGHVTLSTGEPGVAIGITLLKLVIQDGRANWTEAGSHQTTPEGEFRFSGLEDGAYTLVTQPEFDNEHASAPACNGPAPASVFGYPIVFYGDAADTVGADRIRLSSGRQAEANLKLTLTAFHAFQATVLTPRAGGRWQFTSGLMDRNGQPLSYPLREDEKTHSICAYLPDGSYTLTVEGTSDEEPDQASRVPVQSRPPAARRPQTPRRVAGMLDFIVDTQAQTHLRVPLSAGVSTPIHLRYEPARPADRRTAMATEESEDGEGRDPDPLGLWALRVNGAGARGETQLSAERADTDLYELAMAAPGAYWVHASSNRQGTCLGAVTAGGVNLARAPWVVGTLGTGPAIEAVVRTDCAKLELRLPLGVLGDQPGEESTLYVYVVPEFESIQEVRMIPVHPSTDSTVPLEDLTPGDYRVFVFDTPRPLEYRNPAAMDRLANQGQHVTLSPGGNRELILEVPAR